MEQRPHNQREQRPTTGPNGGPTTGSGSDVLVGLVIVLLVGAAVGYFLGRRRGRHGRPGARVRAASRPGAPAVVTVRETPARGEATHVVRLEPHPDTSTQTIRDMGTQTIREVDDDHGRGPD